jgi:hypothetical protein
MKKFILSFVIMMAAWMGASAMSFERAQAEALYLTDKMAYELNLNDQQYNDAYEINLDYFLRIDSPADLYGDYYSYRLYDLRCILHDWQYSLLTAADYFLRPILWRAGGWYFPIYSYYNRGYFYYSRPSVWVSYYGGHGRSYYRNGFYADRRPHWNGGLRGHDMHRPAVGHAGGRNGGRRISGNGYHIDMNGHRPGGSSNHGGSGRPDGGNHSGMTSHGGHGDSNHSGGVNPSGSRPSGGNAIRGNSLSRGNSFDGSSSRMSGSHMGGSMSRGSSVSHSSSMGNSRGSSSFGGSSRSSSPSMGSSRGSSMSGSSRGGGFSGGSSRGGGSFGGGSRGGAGGSRGGRR